MDFQIVKVEAIRKVEVQPVNLGMLRTSENGSLVFRISNLLYLANISTTLPMLTRRIFQQLTDSILLNSPYKPQCLCALPSPLRPSQRQDNRIPQSRNASSSSSTRWKSRQSKDRFSKEAKVQGLKSRAAFKLLEVQLPFKFEYKEIPY